MKIGARLAVSALVLGLGGCQSMAVAALKQIDEEPFALKVQAAPLQLASLAPQPEPLAAPAPAAEPAAPARTDVRGAGDGSMKIDRVIITGNTKEIRRQVPNFSREQIASMVCGSGPRGQKLVGEAVDTWKATVAAHDTRAAYEAGAGTIRQLNAAEKTRTTTLKKFMGPGLGWGNTKKDDLPEPEQDGLVLENVDLYTFKENGLDVMAVSGVVRNTGAAPVETPPLTLQALDDWEFILAGQSSLLPFDQLAPGEARPFEMRFLNPPDTTAEVYAHFAPPFEYRANRLCENFDPQTATAQLAAATDAPATGPVHTAPELNQLTRLYRNEIEAAWNCRKGKDSEPPKGGLQFQSLSSGERREGFAISLSVGKPNMERRCAPAAQRLRWREMFALAEATDEAWGAMLGANETRRRLSAGEATQSEADAADLRQQQTYAVFRDLGRKALARVGDSAPDIAIDLDASTYGYAGFDKGGFYLDISGTLRNTGANPRKLEALMLALVDRLEQPIISITLDAPDELAPGESRPFKERIHLQDPTHRTTGFGRQPPWQVRIGAMAAD